MQSDLNPLFSNKKTLEKYSSAFTLSDMEIFIFPELFYPLVIANIMSPVLWKWRDDPWFKGIEKKNFNSKANRIKQYIIQNYIFNLDLSTWGLTSKTNEIARFSDFFDIELLKQSNALFGYEGDKYYFDIDIRKHFGLDKYNSDIIPYWKTETIEAMNAFKHKEKNSTGAGECVSLSALYASALFVVGRIPLEKIFLIATPLHSQNFVTEKEGLITNNRRIVTKNMWYNGTSFSEKARRALENEKVTIVAHITGYIHVLYNDATINKSSYNLFSQKLTEFLKSELTSLVFINFLRFKSKYKTLFQYRCECSGKNRYISLEKMFEYEHTSKYNVSADTRASLVKEIEGDEFHLSPILGKIFLNDIENVLDNSAGKSLEAIRNEVNISRGTVSEDVITEMFNDIHDFIITDPCLPDSGKDYKETYTLCLSTFDSRETIIEKINNSIDKSELSLLSLYVYRDMDKIDWLPFIKAAIERNPVCFNDLNEKSTDEVYKLLINMSNDSVYDNNRLALPDEIWNFKRGDGIEKALLLSDIIVQRENSAGIEIIIDREKVSLESAGSVFQFTSHKNFRKRISIRGKEISVE
ncbi:MAG: hypothetical protein A2X05_04295 [Bacteroidetes bacterium GWE2_41_25]|nr:MAG: hypothetical protein A2X03_18635 [Bacteroidetes bacterium GWA2_40_15]OFX92182.1 MAG: hypothetical protein A2X06_06675 [Bacteroidetes bacterium GWC2_40_22]OFY01991.1 MAG: hypothetical protein A2X05_04295 [Bacteroidetes bacterium GWE2_41_25]OFY57203.1 MAG: hypothetical protein A2X04_15120 [Bacteroidetes bacterium GWF2_41_9]HBH82985.1 hypothetical protein [Bacteroidales bacterium]